MLMDIRRYAVFILCIAAIAVLTSCSIPSSNTREEIPDFIEKTCESENGVTVHAWETDDTLWVYSSNFPKGYLPPLGASQWLKKEDGDPTKRLWYRIKKLDVLTKAHEVEYRIDAPSEISDIPGDGGWQEDAIVKEQVQAFSRVIFNIVWRANLTLDNPFKFNVIIVSSPNVDYDQYVISFFPDNLKFNMRQISIKEAESRRIVFSYFHPHSRNDTSGGHIIPYDISPNEFVSTLLQAQIIKDIRDESVKIENNDSEPELNSLKDILDIAGERTESVMPIYSDIHSFFTILLKDLILSKNKTFAFKASNVAANNDYMPEQTISKMFTVQFYHNLAYVSFSDKRYEEAKAYLDKIFNLDPNYAFAHILSAQILVALDKPKEALAIYKTVVDKYPRLLQALQGLAGAHYALGEYQEVLEVFKTIAKHSPDWWQSYYGQGSAYQAMGNYDMAVELYHKALEVLEETVKEAKKDFFKRIDNDKVDMDRAMIKTAIGNVYSAMGVHNLAENYLDQSLTLNEGNIQTLLKSGLSHQMQGETEKALIQYQKALDIDKDSLFANWHLGRAYAQLGQHDKALMYYEEAILLEPTDTQRRDLYYDIASAHLQAKKSPSKALIYLKDALTLDPGNVKIIYGIGNAYFVMENYVQAEEHFQEVLEIDNGYAHAYTGLGFIYFQKKDYNQAKINFAKAKELHLLQGNLKASKELDRYLQYYPRQQSSDVSDTTLDGFKTRKVDGGTIMYKDGDEELADKLEKILEDR
jgi:tetratricopeptide (TPR) repeat protein